MPDAAASETAGARAPVTVPSGLIEPLIAMARAQAVPVADILDGLGLPAGLFDDPQAPVLLADYYRIQNQISAYLEDETCQLSTRQLLPGTTDYILAQMAGVSSLHEAMKIVARSYNLLHGGEYNAVRRRGESVAFVIDDEGFPYTIKDRPDYIAFSVECLLIFLHCMLKLISPDGAAAGLRKIVVKRPRRERQAGHLACWTAPIEFGAPHHAIYYDSEIAMARITPPPAAALSAARVHAEIIAMAEAGDRHGPLMETEDFVRVALKRGVIDQTRIAALLGVSAATLRRRLDEEGTSFRDLRRDVLNDAAKRLLAKRQSVAEVSEELGFSEFRSVNRAFKSWNGETPKAYADRIASRAE